MSKILFIVKKRISYGISYGLINSARFVADMLNQNGHEAKVVDVVDNNGIDREVSLFKPDFCIVEALWVIPSKFEVLLPLHPNVKWSVRLHSKPSFLANEGIAMEWLVAYGKLMKKYPNFQVSCNNEELADSLRDSLGLRTWYSPNVYYPSLHRVVK